MSTRRNPVQAIQDLIVSFAATLTTGMDLLTTLLNPVRTNTPTTLSVSTSSAEISSPLTVGLYEMSTDVDVCYRQGTSGQTATTSDADLFSGTVCLLKVRGSTDNYIAAITPSGSGTLKINKISG